MKKCFLGIIFSPVFFAYSQDTPLLDEIQDSAKTTQKVISTFKYTRVINAHSVEMLHKGNLDFKILHRFGFLNDGAKEFFGLDQASMRMGFDYGISDNFTVGIGRSTLRKELDIFVKTRLVQQSIGQKNIHFLFTTLSDKIFIPSLQPQTSNSKLQIL